MKITVRKLIDDHFNGDRKVAAKAAGMTIFFLNNLVHQGREVMLLDDGDFILVTKITKIITMPKVNGSKNKLSVT